ncbi:hypothetical protein [Pseudomonas typographi]|uniref:hypothetical protein n=1 Tax=Pseudomonas typographi TaxID=2715964 RepID=UPI001687FD59|nr:hypothetical protein [Pseudomonas typographi]MBD1554789.1 hypothetical protein [Pseudomonas typographi]
MVNDVSWIDMLGIYLRQIADLATYWYGPICLSSRLALNVITVWSIVSYMSAKRTNLRATLLAILLASSSGYMFFQGAAGFDRLSRYAEMGLVVYTYCVAYICVVNRGNMAKPLRSLWRW